MSDYLTLYTALPYLGALEEVAVMPVSRLALDKRLSMLSDEAARQLALAEQLYFPSEQMLTGQKDNQLVQQLGPLLAQVTSSQVRERIAFKLELDTFLAALRYRQAGESNPEHFSGLGRWVGRIRQNWHEPGLGLDTFFPVLEPVLKSMNKNEPGQVEQQRLGLLWQDLHSCEAANRFSLDAVICYVLRWGVLQRYPAGSSEQVGCRFAELTSALLDSTSLKSSLEALDR